MINTCPFKPQKTSPAALSLPLCPLTPPLPQAHTLPGRPSLQSIPCSCHFRLPEPSFPVQPLSMMLQSRPRRDLPQRTQKPRRGTRSSPKAAISPGAHGHGCLRSTSETPPGKWGSTRILTRARPHQGAPPPLAGPSHLRDLKAPSSLQEADGPDTPVHPQPLGPTALTGSEPRSPQRRVREIQPGGRGT